MSVDRVSVTVPSDVGAALRALADARGQTVSAIVTDAIVLLLRLAALDQALDESDRRFGPVPKAAIAAAEAELLASGRVPRARRRR